MTDFLEIVTCFEVTDEVVEAALRPADDMNDASPRARVFALLDHMASIARPKAGAPRILRVLARVAACDWVDGELDVRVVGFDEKTALELYVNDGLSLSKMRDPIELIVPYEELRKAIAAKPALLAPLVVEGQIGATKTRLVAKGATTASMPPLSAATEELFSASPVAIAPPPAARAPRPAAPEPPPARAPQPTLMGVAEPPAPVAAPPRAAIGKLTLAKRPVPAPRPRDPKASDRSAPRLANPTKASSGKRAPRPPRKP